MNENNNTHNNNFFVINPFRWSKHITKISILSLFVLFFLFNTNILSVFGQRQNSILANEDINIVAVGDFYCNDETEDTIENIININPELIITTGDHVKDVKSIKCWSKMSEQLKDKMRIAVGNHDAEFKKIYKQIVDYHQLDNPFYSNDFANIHIISLSTEHPFNKGSEQYKFIKNDLKNASKNSNIDWIIVHQHKPYYSTALDVTEAEELRDTFLPLFEKYGVDMIISSHNQYYERTYPILYNAEMEETGKKSVPQPIVTDDSLSYYENPDGIIFLTVGTAGDELAQIKKYEDYFVIQQDDVYGFLNLDLENNGKSIVGDFHSNNDDEIIDHFELTKTS
jgi:Calcineurin-like phosphoesterase